MIEYTPDVWVIVEISGTKVPETYRRILAGWHGGFANGDSWKMSSGIKDMIDRGDHWEIPNHSGSVYFCYKNRERFSGYTSNIYKGYIDQNNEEFMMKHVQIGDTDEEKFCDSHCTWADHHPDCVREEK